jgi:hypothetical protein
MLLRIALAYFAIALMTKIKKFYKIDTWLGKLFFWRQNLKEIMLRINLVCTGSKRRLSTVSLAHRNLIESHSLSKEC